MGYKCRFLDNEEYGAEDISAVFSHIIGAGVLAYPEQTTVAGALNTLTAETVGAGVSEYGGLSVSASDGKILIGRGAAFFESGVSVEVDSDGAELEYEPGSQVYVSLIYEADFNTAAPAVTQSLPEGDVVVLARIDAEGKVYDLRRYAAAKGSINTANVYHDFSITLSGFRKKPLEENYIEYKLPHCGFKYLLLRGAECERMTLLPEEFIADISAEGESKLLIFRGASKYYLHIRRTGSSLYFTASGSDNGYPQTYTLTLA